MYGLGVQTFHSFRAWAGGGICTSSMEFPTSLWKHSRMNPSFSETTVSRHIMNMNLLKILTKNRKFILYTLHLKSTADTNFGLTESKVGGVGQLSV
ncbi:hypothetical protein EG68_09138 [Paragonimus skrjabini miyazakii]|uniref:Uncharacterized protein n=1 Tax=Paragonimus skrjabini miyazakii TaxID=59628 RepID=A0A8S9YLG4_9TREM|nr:hypothetical protein EG68_09138 [Paragonimus skrjabini miyazakii]